jgi:hypothetical protein
MRCTFDQGKRSSMAFTWPVLSCGNFIHSDRSDRKCRSFLQKGSWPNSVALTGIYVQGKCKRYAKSSIINFLQLIRLYSASLQGAGELASSTGTSRDGLGLVTGRSTLELLANLLHGGSASSRVDSSRVAKVGVDANEALAAGGLDTFHDDVTLSALLAVSARTVQFSKVGNFEARNGHCASSIVLNHLVCSACRASACDGGIPDCLSAVKKLV